jgi:hypothetical protein
VSDILCSGCFITLSFMCVYAFFDGILLMLINKFILKWLELSVGSKVRYLLSVLLKLLFQFK